MQTQTTTPNKPEILRQHDLRVCLQALKPGTSLRHENLSFYEKLSPEEHDFIDDNPWMQIQHTVTLPDGRLYNGY